MFEVQERGQVPQFSPPEGTQLSSWPVAQELTPVVGQVAGLIRSGLQELVVQILSLMTQEPLYGAAFGTSSMVPWTLMPTWAKAEVDGTARRARAVSPSRSL